MAEWGAFEAEDIVKFGYMMIKRPPTSTKVRLKAWQSKFFVLRDESRHSAQRLEYYKDEAAFGEDKRVEHSVFLDSVVYIGETSSSKTYQYALMVVCSRQGAFTLACDTAEDLMDWLQALNKVAIKVGGASSSSPDAWPQANGEASPATTPELSRRASSNTISEVTDSVQRHEASSTESNHQSGYLVTTRLTPLSEKNGIRGDYVMCVTNGEVVLQSTNDRSQTVVRWPVIHLRAFKSEQAESSGVKDMRLLTLNVGRRSPTGEGILQFFTKLGDNIANEIRLQSSYYVSKTASEKRDVFRRQTASSESQETRSPPRTSTRKLPRTMTAPPKRLTSVREREVTPLVDSVRARADTDPITNATVEEKHRSAISEPAELQQSVSSEGSRSRSATDSSVERSGDDEVFSSQPAVDESEAAGTVSKEKEPNAYIDLVADENAEPMHISDPAPPRKASAESHVSGMSPTEEGSRPFPRSFASTQLISEENETDSEGYIKCEALQTGPQSNEEVNKLDGNRNVLDPNMTEFLEPACPLPTSQSLPNCSLTTNVLKKGPTLKYSPGGAVSKKLRENLVAQIQAPTGQNGYILPPKPTLERERALTSECVFPPRSRADNKESHSGGDTRMDVTSRLALLEKLKDPESSKKLFDQIIAQMEKPQQNDVNELFPTGRQKRNSIGAVSTETVREIQQKTGAFDAKTSLLVQNKHTLIENSNLTNESQDTGNLHPILGPPPLPVRLEFTEQTCKRSSMGDIFEDIHRRSDLFGHGDRPTFFAKGMRNKNPSGPLGPLRNTISATLGGEAGITARLIEKTEMRDEVWGSCTTTGRKFHVSESKTCSIANGGSSTIVLREETFLRSSVAEKSIAKSLESLDSRPDEETHTTIGRRKDSRASKIVKKIWKNLSPSESLSKHSPKPRRGSNESRASDDISEDDFERPRRASLSPGDAILVQGRFSENEEEHTPESSPKLHRKISKSSPKSTRKTSRDEKVKKDEDSPKLSRGLSSATRVLRKVSKGESKRDECSSRSAFKALPTSPSSIREVSKVELQKKSDVPLSPKLPITEMPKPDLPPKGARWQSKDEKPLNSLESVKVSETNCQEESEPTDEQLLREARGDDCAPALPPRRKSDPPPLPPRRARSSPSFGVNGFVPHSTSHHHPARSPQLAAASGRRHSGQKGVCVLPKEDFLPPPPPVPPRKENNRSPSPKSVMAHERSSARAPVIQLTCSSPENQLDDSGMEDSAAVKPDKASEGNPPNLSTTRQSSGSLSHPVPRRPPKGEQRRMQAKEFFRSGGAQAVWQPSCDSEDLTDSCVANETDNNNLPSCSSRYGNVDDFKIACNESICNTTVAVEADSSDESDSSNRLITESCHVTDTSCRTMVDSCRTVESQKGAVRLKVSLRKEASFEETC